MTQMYPNNLIQSVSSPCFPGFGGYASSIQTPKETKKEELKMDEKIISLKKGFKERKDSLIEVCIVEVGGTAQISIDKKIFEAIQKEMGW